MKRYIKFQEMKQYYYLSPSKTRSMGMKSSGSFTQDISSWMTFSEVDKNRFESENIIPYGSTKKGIFVDTDKF